MLSLFGQCPVTINAGGPTTFCKGLSVLLSASGGGGYTWQWKKNSTNIVGATAQSYTATTGGAYTVLVTATGGCTALSNSILVTVTLESVYATANGFTGIGCLNGNVNLSLNNATGITSYQWKLNAVNIAGATAMNYTGTLAGTYSCQISNGTCTVITNTLPVQNQVATLNHNGPTIFCVDQTNLSISLNMASSPAYQWKNNGNIIPGATSGTYSATSSGNYSCVITEPNFCNAPTTSGSINIQAGVPPQISVTTSAGASSANLCNGQTIDLVVNDISTGQIWPGGVVDWQKDAVSISPFPGGNYLLGVSESGVYNALITTTCGISFAQMGLPVVSLIPGVSPYVSSNGITSNCSVVTLHVEPASISFAPYQWKLNGVNIPGANSFYYDAIQSGLYTCEVSNSCGTMVAVGFNQNPLNITITGAVAQITPQGSTSICAGSSVVLNATAAGASGYQWYLNSVIIGGATGATYSASAAGSYTVRVTSPGCFPVTSAPVSVTVNAIPTPVITTSGSVSFCNGDSVTLSVISSLGATYQWKKNNVNISGATSQNYKATSSGYYKVEKTNASGCKGTSPGKTITVYNNPSVALVAQGPTTFCVGDSVKLSTNYSANYTYIWKRNNVNISGATLNKYYAKTAGFYKVKVTAANGCTVISPAIQVTVPCKEGEILSDISTGLNVSVYPNPSDGEFSLMMLAGRLFPEQISIVELTGRQVDFNSRQKPDGTITISGLANGIYILFINNHNRFITKKIIVAN